MWYNTNIESIKVWRWNSMRKAKGGQDNIFDLLMTVKDKIIFNEFFFYLEINGVESTMDLTLVILINLHLMMY